REALIRPPHRDAKARGLERRDVSKNRRRNRVDIQRRAAGEREVRDPERMSDAVSHSRPRLRRPEHNFDAAHPRDNLAHVQVTRGRPQVADEARDEPWAVSSFEGDFLIMNDDGCHAMAWAA